MRWLVLGLLLLAPAPAAAHGREPFVGRIALDPGSGALVARATWGLVLTDDGDDWRWVCAAAMGTLPTREDPPLVLASDGAIVVGNIAGIWRSQGGRCGFERAYDAASVIDLDARPSAPDELYALVSDGVDHLERSEDGGRTWARIATRPEGTVMERLRLAPSDPEVVYLSGVRLADASTPRAVGVHRSSDGGRSFTGWEIPLLEGERNARLLAIDPTDPDRLLVHLTRRAVDGRPERVLLSEDGGRSFALVLEGLAVADAAFSADGARAWVALRASEGLHRSDDGGRTFTLAHEGDFPCVTASGDTLWVCVDETRDGYAVGRSTDGGDTVTPVLRFDDVRRLPDCPMCSEVAYVCPAWYPDLAFDLGHEGAEAPDGGVTGAPRDVSPPAACVDGGPEPPSPSEGCGCRAAGGASTPWLALLLLSAAGLRSRRARRRRA